NNASANGTDPGSSLVENFSLLNLDTNYTARIEVEKTANRSTVFVGDWINYTVWVNNTGNVNLTGAQATDNLTGQTWNLGTLAPGQKVQRFALYQVKLADLCEPIFNNASANGTDPCGSLVENFSILSVATNYTARIEVGKIANRSTAEIGSWINYTVWVNNTGNVNLTDVVASDNLTGQTWNLGTLVPGQKEQRFALYRVEETDLCRPLVNNISANGTGPCPDSDVENSSIAIVATNYTARIEVDKIANVSTVEVGSWINYTVWVNNTGNVNLTNAQARDNLTGQIWNLGTLVPGQKEQRFVLYRIGETDLCKPLVNNVTANGSDPCDNLIGNFSIASVETTSSSGVEVTKTANRSTVVGGDWINYTVWVNNTGNVNLTDVRAQDNLTGQIWNLGTLVPGQKERRFALYRVGEDDLCGSLVNNVTANGTDPCGNFVENFSIVSVDTNYTSRIEVTKTANVSIARVGDLIGYSVWVNNTGNVNLTNVQASDNLTGELWNLDRLGPGQSKTRSFEYRVKETDLCKPIVNKVAANGTDPCGNFVENFSIASVDMNFTARIEVNKTANTSTAGVGSWINYTVWVNNTGDINLTGAQAQDNLTGETWGLGTLAPGQREQRSVKYQVKEKDLCGPLVNRVTAGGVGLCCGLIQNFSTATVTTQYDPGIEVNNTANVSRVEVDGRVNYTVRVNNTGNVNLTNVQIHDDLTEETLDLGTIPPGDVSVLSFEYKVLEKDLCKLLVNNVTANGTDPCGGLHQDSSIATVETNYSAAIEVNKTADADSAEVRSIVTYTIVVNNSGNVNLTDLQIHDNLTKDLWKVAVLGPGMNQSFTAEYLVKESDLRKLLVNTVTANGTDPCGGVVGPATDTVKVNTTMSPSLNVTMAANFTGSVVLGDVVGYNITMGNDGNVNLTDVQIRDNLTGESWWAKDPLGPGESETFETAYKVTVLDVARGKVVNNASVNGTDPRGGEVGPVEASLTLDVVPELNVTKKADKEIVKRGEMIAYNITICNYGISPVTNVLVRDVFTRHVEFVSASPMPGPDGVWRFAVIPGQSCVSIILVVKVPKQDLEFGMDQAVSGDGFVNVASDYSTTLQPYVIRNEVRVVSDETVREFYASETVSVLGDPGTELSTREHGSGLYESEEQVQLLTKNKSISMEKDMAAIYAPTTLGLYNNRTATYSSKWTEEAKAKNRVTGATMTESYRYATSIDRESRMMLDENESAMEVNSEFDGMGHIGFLKMPTNSTPGVTPIFEAREDYTGSFKILEKVDEYGSSVSSEKATSGEGFVAVDKRVGDSQRSYESGTGTYDSEELIETNTNYIAKDIGLIYAPMNQSLTDDVSIDASQKWKEGMYSKVRNTSFIGEEYTGVTELDKETVALGLNEMDTEAEFSGKARYRAVLRDEVDLDEQYEGDYSIERKILFTGIPKYDRPHLTVVKNGSFHKETIFDAKDTTLAGESRDKVITVATYIITVENDGNRALGPIYVKDLFPPKAVYINSSVRPTELTETYANWTLTHLAIGDVSTIVLNLDVTKHVPAELVNRVEVCGGYNGDEWVCASNFTAVEKEWLACCLNENVSVTKTAEVDEMNSSVVWYKIDVVNMDDVTRVATVTDSLPAGMALIDSMVPFASYEKNTVTWNLVEIEPFETVTIAYRVKVSWPGRFVNSVEVDARSVDGQIVQPVYANSVVEVGEVQECGTSSCTGWSPPNWDFEYVGYPAELTCNEMTCEEKCGLAL
ncbi:MAG TPA: DUF11 domain-containing protein, partial [Methanotrichaceae archaeon]|nr:DUF11 domain-containing protein [Methanotrichaceae archaeon]